MKITAAEEYGLRCLLHLARGGPNKQLPISEIADREGLSIPYASKLLAILRRAGLVAAARGRGGGFSITREPDKISLYEVLTALGGPMIDRDHCAKYTGQLPECVHGVHCSVEQIFCGLAGYVQDFLTATSIQGLIDGRHREYLRQSSLTATGAGGASAENSGDAKEHPETGQEPASE